MSARYLKDKRRPLRWSRGSSCRKQPPFLWLREQRENLETQRRSPAELRLWLLRREGNAPGSQISERAGCQPAVDSVSCGHRLRGNCESWKSCTLDSAATSVWHCLQRLKNSCWDGAHRNRKPTGSRRKQTGKSEPRLPPPALAAPARAAYQQS